MAQVVLDRSGNDASAPGIAVVEVGDSCRIALALHHMGQERAETEARHAKAEEREKVDHRQIHLIIHEDLRAYLEWSVYNTSRRRCFRVFDLDPGFDGPER